MPPETLIIVATAIVASVVAIAALRAAIRHARRRRNGDYSLIDAYEGGIHWDFVPQAHLNDENSLQRLADEFDFAALPPEEQTAYLRAQDFTKQNPPRFEMVRGSTFTAADEQLIRDFGIAAFLFEQDTLLQPRYVVMDKTELNFLNSDLPYQTVTAVLNYPYPTRNRVTLDIVYFETKVFEFAQSANGHFSVGLVTKPYPSDFRLPGYNLFSIAYESTGNLKINKPFPTPSQQHTPGNPQYNAFVLPPLIQSDVVGFGYVISTGTVFITRNGKKLMEVASGCYVDMYPAVGCFLTNAKFHVNLGQMGFVWIEANVRKYGFVGGTDYRRPKPDSAAALPQYNIAPVADKLLDKGDDLPPRYPEHELDFFGRLVVAGTLKHLTEGSSTRITNESDEEMDRRQRCYEGGEGDRLLESKGAAYGAVQEARRQAHDREDRDVGSREAAREAASREVAERRAERENSEITRDSRESGSKDTAPKTSTENDIPKKSTQNETSNIPKTSTENDIPQTSTEDETSSNIPKTSTEDETTSIPKKSTGDSTLKTSPTEVAETTTLPTEVRASSEDAPTEDVPTDGGASAIEDEAGNTQGSSGQSSGPSREGTPGKTTQKKKKKSGKKKKGKRR